MELSLEEFLLKLSHLKWLYTLLWLSLEPSVEVIGMVFQNIVELILVSVGRSFCLGELTWFKDN